ncbi:tryptophan synthase beta subunit-like PLP-dependent enzyme [Aspergillus egyptiacus]|nr:tryptophan synthase beta subunit-like PLP-dependent enzyme [Aspergillus egyptiacus]
MPPPRPFKNLALPESLASLPRYPLLYPSPSPIHPLPSLQLQLSLSLSCSGDSSATSTGCGSSPSKTASASASASKSLNSNSNGNRNGNIRITLHAKREDHSSPLASSGNKYRKLEYIVPDILASRPRFGGGVGGEIPALAGIHHHSECEGQEEGEEKEGETMGEKDKKKITTVVTEGAIQSNHTVQVAATAKRIGLQCVVLLHKGTGAGFEASRGKEGFLRGGNVQIVKLLGGDVRVFDPHPPQDGIGSGSGTGHGHDIVEGVLESLRAEGKRVYWIPSGASLHPLGGVGYARCAFEIAEQEREIFGPGFPGPGDGDGDGDGEHGGGSGRFDYIFVAGGSGSTIAGLVAGFKLLDKIEQRGGRARKVIGILTSPTKPKDYHEERVLRFARQAGRLIGLDAERDITMSDVHLDDRFVGEAYGLLDAETKSALSLMAEKEQVILDPVYTAKVVRGMMHWVEKGEIEGDVAAATGDDQEKQQVNVLFIHTGGQSALGAYADA